MLKTDPSLQLPDLANVQDAILRGVLLDALRSLSEAHRKIYDDLNTVYATEGTPTGNADTAGDKRDIWFDDSYIYVKTDAGWKRAALSSF